MDFTSAWEWPQWAVVILLFLGFTITATQHGKPKVLKDGAPEMFNGFVSLGKVAMWGFILIAGGFFS